MVEYETTYFHRILGVMVGQSVQTDFTSAHYRMWLTQFLVAIPLQWTGNGFWSFAIVELAGAWLGVVGIALLGQQLGLSRRATLLGGGSFALSPLILVYMWRHQLHVAAIGSMAFGVGASCAVLFGHRPWWQRGTLLGCIWLTVSLLYQYHWVVALTALGMVFTSRAELRVRLLGWVGAVIAFFLSTLVLQALVAAYGIPVLTEGNDPRYPLLRLLANPLVAGELFWPLRVLASAVWTLSTVYHPVMLIMATLGIVFGSRRVRLILGTMVVATVGFLMLLNLDRVAHAAYPAVYLGAANTVFMAPYWMVRFARWGGLSARVVGILSHAALLGALFAVLAVTLQTNSDIWGDYRYVWSLSHELFGPMTPR